MVDKEKPEYRKITFLERSQGDLFEAIQAITKLYHEKKLDGVVMVWREKDRYGKGTPEI